MARIRSANLKDVKNLVSLWKEYRRDYEETLFNENPKLIDYLVKKDNCADVFDNIVKDSLNSENAHIWIVEDENKPIGFSLAYIKENYPIYIPKKIGQMKLSALHFIPYGVSFFIG